MPTIPRGNGRLAVVGASTTEASSAHAHASPVVALGPVETKSLELVDDDTQAVADAVVETASELIGAGRDAARLTVIAKAIAREEQRHHSLARLHDQLVCARDLEALDVVARLLTASNRRLCALVAEHRACTHVGQRAAVVVGHADRVHVTTEK
jgi:hypothetical protein